MSKALSKNICEWREGRTKFYTSCNGGKAIKPDKPSKEIIDMLRSWHKCVMCGREIKWKD